MLLRAIFKYCKTVIVAPLFCAHTSRMGLLLAKQCCSSLIWRGLASIMYCRPVDFWTRIQPESLTQLCRDMCARKHTHTHTHTRSQSHPHARTELSAAAGTKLAENLDNYGKRTHSQDKDADGAFQQFTKCGECSRLAFISTGLEI
ncbi:hypothetical protein DUNSADRAFT_2733 [Dunaliella salina]|uniref:Secreted protein n=1 Tax=Dunaliella salina TaxID=3046 RepID=A0ABQ7FW83_DUNSA|nr:hypothetical protein DUNSADRAFT_2733 [Dunaliella salina]|eukprot:KAF5826571.1 hypothetical protein DUNSADRAFT_2733 [Dunaliella salina]